MTFIIILCALIIERFFDWQQLRTWHWFNLYQYRLSAALSGLPQAAVLLVSIVTPLLVIGVLNHMLSGVFYNFFKLIFGLGVLLYCFGPENFWAQVYQIIAKFHLEDKPAALAQMQLSFPAASANEFTQRIFIEANRRVFAVIVWFLLFGPMGAMLYRLIDLIRRQNPKLEPIAIHYQSLMDWLPIRLLTILFALAGHFNAVIKQWKISAFSAPLGNEQCLTQCGIAALDLTQNGRLPEDGSAEKEALGLLDRAFVIGLVILAVMVLIK